MVAHANPQPAVEQYDLLLDGQSFFALPTLPQLLAWHQEVTEIPDERETLECSNEVSADVHDIGEPSVEVAEGTAPSEDKQEQHRLSLAGLKASSDANKDELRSELYASALDTLRDESKVVGPEMEDIMSRAIVNALSEDAECEHDYDDSLSLEEDTPLDPTELEADMMFEAIEWSKKHSVTSDIDYIRREFMEELIGGIVCHVNHSRLSPHDGSAIAIRISAVLGLPLNENVPQTMVGLSGLGHGVTTFDVTDAMSKYGQVDVAAVARKYEGFAICRFVTEEAADRACDAGSRDELVVNGVRPEIFDIISPPEPFLRERSTGSSYLPSLPATPSNYDSDDERKRLSAETSSLWSDGPREEETSFLSDLDTYRRTSLKVDDLQLRKMSTSKIRDMSTCTVSTIASLDDVNASFTRSFSD